MIMPIQSRERSAFRKSQPPFDPRSTYRVFRKRAAGGGRTTILVECDPEGAGGDGLYEHSTATREKRVVAWEITSPGLATSYPINRAAMGLWGFVGTISGYGANAFFLEGGNLLKYVREFGACATRPSLIKRLWNWLFGAQLPGRRP